MTFLGKFKFYNNQLDYLVFHLLDIKVAITIFLWI